MTKLELKAGLAALALGGLVAILPVSLDIAQGARLTTAAAEPFCGPDPILPPRCQIAGTSPHCVQRVRCKKASTGQIVTICTGWSCARVLTR